MLLKDKIVIISGIGQARHPARRRGGARRREGGGRSALAGSWTTPNNARRSAELQSPQVPTDITEAASRLAERCVAGSAASTSS